MVSGAAVRVRHLGWMCGLVVALLVVGAGRPHAQIPTSGLNVVPSFEGWEPNPDGSFNLVFGYFNRNWEQEIDVPIGPNNSIEPGGPDQGQPTHFYPRRSRFVFRVRVPKDFGKQEVVWTLTSNGRTQRAYGTLHPDYIINMDVIQSNNGESSLSSLHNQPPVLKVEGEPSRQVKVGTPVALTAIATDDGIPEARPMPPPGSLALAAGVPMAAMGLRFSWFVYRGAGNVIFDPPQFSAWEDDRDTRDSPFSPGWKTPPVPANNKWEVRATFSEPGTYVLRALAHDGGLLTATDITFVVSR